MSRKSHWFWYGVSSLAALWMLWSAGGRLQASWLTRSALGRERPATSIVAAAQAQGDAAEPQHGGAAEPAASEAEAKKTEHSVWAEVFHWFNFLLILGGIGYLVRKFLVPFLEERGRAIREEMERSAQALAAANQRLSTIEEKLKHLHDEIGALRRSALQEAAAERARIEEQAKADANKILAASEQEIETAVKAARQALQVYTAELALGAAEKKIRDSLTPWAEQRLLRSFLHGLAGNSTGGNGEPSSHSAGGPASNPLPHEKES